MNQQERIVISIILLGTATFVGIDLSSDFQEGVQWWHLAIEALVALTALFGVLYLVKGSFKLKKSLEIEILKSHKLQLEADDWRKKSKVHIEGLSQEIDRQLDAWKLSVSEKEVALLLLKGLSLKEIAEIRKTSDKTARAQSIAVYEKSGLAGRSELAAFFLEDLLMPHSK